MLSRGKQAKRTRKMQENKKEKMIITLPLIALRGSVAFPNIQLETELSRPFSVKAFGKAASEKTQIFLIAQKELETDVPNMRDLFKTGTICNIKNASKNPDGTISATFEGVCRAKIIDLTYEDGYLTGVIEPKTERIGSITPETVGLMQDISASVAKIREYVRSLTEEFTVAAASVKSPAMFADFIASGALFNYVAKQEVLDSLIPTQRLEKLAVLLQEELELAECEFKIHKKVKAKVDAQHKEFYLREQMRAIQHELGEDDDDISELSDKIERAKLPKEVKEKLEKELSRLSKTPFGAAEATVLRNYIETCLEIPFSKFTDERVNIDTAREILERDHDGLTKVKERILEYIAVKQISPDVKNQIICLIGAPGVGKTSIARSVAEALGRKYTRVSLGGIRDEADIRGHRKTYVGAMPGRIIDALIKAEVMNPLMVLDELDKLTRDNHGDPSSALLEVLDPEQNKYFRDHFVEMPIDLSDCIFIATANSYDGIPHPLLDRMEIIDIQSYSREEKLSIAKNHLIPKQLRLHGMDKCCVSIDDNAVYTVIDEYTKEAGVRNLERKLAALIRKSAKKIATNETTEILITPESVREMLGSKRVENEKISDTDLIGVVNGLAYTQAGGDLLKIETAVMPGTGKLELTGSLGDIMKESAKLAYSYVRSLSPAINVDASFYSSSDIHIHCPEGAVPKDGPSAGVTMMCSIVSALSGIAVKRDVAMTGELSLTGRVLPIGGLREKTMAAYAAGVTTVIIPDGNRKDLEDIDVVVKEHLNFLFCKTADDVLQNALVDYKALKKESSAFCSDLTAMNALSHATKQPPLGAKSQRIQ